MCGLRSSGCWRCSRWRCSCATRFSRTSGARCARGAAGWLVLLAGVNDVPELWCAPWRWQYLLAPLGHVDLRQRVPARRCRVRGEQRAAGAGRRGHPPVLSGAARAGLSATGAFATIILERLLDVVTVLLLLASFVFVFDPGLRGAANPAAFAVKWAGAVAGGGAGRLSSLVVVRCSPAIRARSAARCCGSSSVLPSRARRTARAARREVRATGSARCGSPAGCWSRCCCRCRCGCRSRLGIWAVARGVPL